MKPVNRTQIAVFLLTLMFTCLSAMAADFCWKDSYGRGIGTLPTACEAGKENQNGLCYSPCRAGMYGEGPVCWSACPAGYRDMGAVCHIDKALTVSGNWECHHRKLGVCWYWVKACLAGYTNAGAFCALNTPSVPAGFTGTGLDPMKNTYGRGAGTIPKGCSSNNQMDAGLCYQTCRAGYNGVGPVCWNEPPKGWVTCGMGAAKDQVTCASTVFSQVSSVGQTAMFIASFGSSTALTEGMSASKDASTLAKLQQEYKALMVQWELAQKNSVAIQNAKTALDTANKGRKGYMALDAASTAVTPEDMVRVAAQILAILEPSGAANIVASYTYSKCSALTSATPVLSSSQPVAPRWVASSYDLSNKGQTQPEGAFIASYEGTRPLRICRAVQGKGTHPGKIYEGRCNIAYGASRVVVNDYEVLVVDANAVAWVSSSWTSSNMGQTQPDGAIIAGYEEQRPLRICRANHAGNWHPGKIYEGKCNFAYGATRVVLPDYEILVSK
jgi:hypothetical protein